jgi:hypothetical protein
MANGKSQVGIYRVWLKDEIPTFGSGQRSVFAKVGPKWTHLLDWTTLNTARIPTLNTLSGAKSWGLLSKADGRPLYRSAFIRNKMLNMIALAKREPTRFEQECLEFTLAPEWAGDL